MTETKYVLVVGLGKTGLSIARYLRRKHMPFIVYDTREQPHDLADFIAEFNTVDVYLQTFPDALWSNVQEIISSPGVSLDEPVMQRAFEKNIPIYGDIECLARETSAPMIAITGTNGKSTVTTLVGEMAKASGMRVAVAGNIGTPVLDLLDDDFHYDLWVLELSSFQLDLTYSLAPIAATILNVTADHLDRHHDLPSYVKAKQRVYHQAATIIYNRDDQQTLPSSYDNRVEVISFGLDRPLENQWGILVDDIQSFLAYGLEKILSVDALKIKGRHNWANALAACALAASAGIDRQTMANVLKQFSGLPHRAQWVRTINGVDWINDSKGTNIGATCSAISGIGEAMQGKIVLIAGGQGKGADFSELRAPIVEHVRTLVLIGQDADKMEQALNSVVQVIRAVSLEEAVRIAHTHAQSGDVVMLSPACASQDMFIDFNDRGRVFVSAVDAL
jgi:UDP-N-acetylmuramoylalanine--D-glutamate ligase